MTVNMSYAVFLFAVCLHCINSFDGCVYVYACFWFIMYYVIYSMNVLLYIV